MEYELNSIIDEMIISENLKLTVSQSIKKDYLFLDIDYMKGKFTINKIFLNNYQGKEELDQTIKEFNTEQKIKDYLKI